ncbi:MAG: hypothetical protein AAGB27_15815 [Pseudomonadota bacterium]
MDSFFKINGALRLKHNYRLDTAYDGRYLMRLPDGRLVPSDRFEEARQTFAGKASSKGNTRR